MANFKQTVVDLIKQVKWNVFSKDRNNHYVTITLNQFSSTFKCMQKPTFTTNEQVVLNLLYIFRIGSLTREKFFDQYGSNQESTFISEAWKHTIKVSDFLKLYFEFYDIPYCLDMVDEV